MNNRMPERVVDEQSPVKTARLSNPLLTAPNGSRPPISTAGWKSAATRSSTPGIRPTPRLPRPRTTDRIRSAAACWSRTRQGHLYLCGLRAVPAVTRVSPGSLSPAGQLTQRGQVTLTLGSRTATRPTALKTALDDGRSREATQARESARVNVFCECRVKN